MGCTAAAAKRQSHSRLPHAGVGPTWAWRYRRPKKRREKGSAELGLVHEGRRAQGTSGASSGPAFGRKESSVRQFSRLVRSAAAGYNLFLYCFDTDAVQCELFFYCF